DDNGTDSDILYALYNSSGSPLVIGAVANTTASETAPHVAMSASEGVSTPGGFAVSYTVDGSDIFVNLYAPGGSQVGDPIGVGAKPARTETGSRIDMSPNGRFAVVYVQDDPHNVNALDVVAVRCKADGKVTDRHKLYASTGGATPGRDV